MTSRLLNKIARFFGVEISVHRKSGLMGNMVSLKPPNGSRGNVLLAYIIDPFLLKPHEKVSVKHNHDWESLQMGSAFLDLGYAVDVIDYRDKQFIPQKNYSIFVSASECFKEIGQKLNNDCIKIVHLETSHFLFNNTAAYQRNLNLQRRRGITLSSLKWLKPNWAIEHADYAVIMGNQFTVDTYAHAQKPYYEIFNPTVSSFPWPVQKNLSHCRGSFLWLGSDGLVHKGLDLVLDAFSGMPDYTLYVCGPIQREKAFEEAYYRELYQTKNIKTIGWVDIDSELFLNIANNCIGLVYPSCAEGQAGSVVNCLQAGLIPIISYESGVDVENMGIILRECTVSEIKAAVTQIASLPEKELTMMARKAWNYAHENHSIEKYKETYKEIILNILKKQSEPQRSTQMHFDDIGLHKAV